MQWMDRWTPPIALKKHYHTALAKLMWHKQRSPGFQAKKQKVALIDPLLVDASINLIKSISLFDLLKFLAILTNIVDVYNYMLPF